MILQYIYILLGIAFSFITSLELINVRKPILGSDGKQNTAKASAEA